MMPRALYGDLYGLVVVDWSLIVRQAWHASGLDGCAAVVAGRLARLLSDPMPASMVVAIDPERYADDGTAFRRWTWRDTATAHLPEKQRYKAGRIPKPAELVKIERRLLDVVRAHRIPVLEPSNPAAEQDYEADDAAATAVRLATLEGRSVALVSLDKDWLQLVRSSRPAVVRWWPFHPAASTEPDEYGDSEVESKFRVRTEQLTDYLAMVGDTSDNVPGVKGLGPKSVSRILDTYGSLDAALEAAPKTRAERLLHEQRDNAIGSRSLVRLWDHAPIQWEPNEQMIGGFDARRLSALWRDFGFTDLAKSIPVFAKQPYMEATI